MSKRSTLRKRANRVRKLMRGKPPRYIDLTEWLRDRRYADTRGQAMKIIADERVRTRGGNVLGREGILVPAELRPEITVRPAK